MVTPSQRVCSKCGRQRDLTEFSPKGPDRYHSRCKACNNEARKTSYRERNGCPNTKADAGAGSLPGRSFQPPSAAPLAVPVEESPHHEARCSVTEMPTPASQPDETHIEPSGKFDFRIWQKLYNRPLTEMERIEIKTNLAAFFALLAEEVGHQSG